MPRRVGLKQALELTVSCKPIGTRAAREMGFLDDVFGEDAGAFVAELRERAKRLASDPEFRVMLRRKHEKRLDDKSIKPLASYPGELVVSVSHPPITRPAAARLQRRSAATAEPIAD